MAQEPNYDMLPDELAMNFLKDSQHDAYFNGFFLGNPEDDATGVDELPALFFTKSNATYLQDATSMDEVTHVLLIRAIINRRSFNDENNWDTAYDYKKLALMIEGTINGVLDPDSILGILRKNFTMNGYVVNNEITVNYGGVRDIFADEITREAQITMTVTRLQQSLKI